MVSISIFTKNFANGQKYVVNLPYTDDFDLPYLSFRINLDAPPEPPFIQRALVKCLPGVRWADDLRNRTRPPPLAASRPTSKRIAIKECSPAELLDDPVVGLVTMSDGVDRRTLEILAREFGRMVLSGAGAECAHKGLSEGAWGRSPGDEPSGPGRILGDYHRLPKRPR